MEVAQPLSGQHTPAQTSADTLAHSALLLPTHDTTMAPTTHDSNVTATATPTLTKQATLISETSSENSDSMRGFSQESNSSMGGGVSSGLSDESVHSADDCQGDDTAARRSFRQQSKERAIEHVLQQGKILKVLLNTFSLPKRHLFFPFLQTEFCYCLNQHMKKEILYTLLLLLSPKSDRCGALNWPLTRFLFSLEQPFFFYVTCLLCHNRISSWTDWETSLQLPYRYRGDCVLD